MLPAGKLENLPDDLAALSATALKYQASVVIGGMETLANPAGAANLAERLQQKFNVPVNEAGTIGYANFQILALLKALGNKPPQQSLETLGKLSDASDKYSNALLSYPPGKLADVMKLNTLKLNIEVQTVYAKTSIDVKAEESGRNRESVAAEAHSKAIEATQPSPEVLDEFNRRQAGTSPPPR